MPCCSILFTDSEYITFWNTINIKGARAPQSLVCLHRWSNQPSEKLDFSMPCCSILFTDLEYIALFETSSISRELEPIKVRKTNGETVDVIFHVANWKLRLNAAKLNRHFLIYIKAFMLYPRASGFPAHDQSLFLWSFLFGASSGFLPYYISSIFSIILSNQLQQQISAKMNTVFTADGLEQLEESMAQCNSFKSMKCSCTDYLCCLPAPPMPEPKVDTTNHDINFIPFLFYLQIILCN